MFLILLVFCTLSVHGIEPECGIVTLEESQVLIIGGKSALRGEVPWYAGIYKKTTRPYKLICGGSLISDRIIISAAHCFWDEVEKQLPASRYSVAVGKLYRAWDANITKETDQKSHVKEIHLPVRYQGSEANNQEDIAIVIALTPFLFNKYVKPICVDFSIALENKQLQSGNKGKVGGWGLITEDGETSQVLKVIELPYVDTKTCIQESPFTYRPHITSDKFCAGYVNSHLAICKGDSGGGLAFPHTDKGKTRYYLRGVASSAPVSEHQCNANAFTGFTHVLKHEQFIKQFWSTTSTSFTTSKTTIDERQNSCNVVRSLSSQKKTGQKAWDKCIEYQEKLVFPCNDTKAGGIMENRCHHNANEGEHEAHMHEFSHMALLGYGDDISDLIWTHSGSLISEKFILSSAYHAISNYFGPATYVALGVLRRFEFNYQKRLKVKQIHKHPGFKFETFTNDVALVELEKPVTLSEFLVPACLYTGDDINDDLAMATGWGRQRMMGDKTNVMKKMYFTKYDSKKCAEKFPPNFYLPNGFDINTQFCYLRTATSVLACGGDGGDPLQVKSTKISCMYTLIGLMSYGKGCDTEDSPWLFTRVEAYVDWIEKIVWP